MTRSGRIVLVAGGTLVFALGFAGCALIVGLLSHPACRAAISPASQGLMRLTQPGAADEFLSKLEAELEREADNPTRGDLLVTFPEQCRVVAVRANTIGMSCRPQASPHAVTP